MHTVSATYLQTLGSAMVGLLGEETPYPVYFKTRWGIHTFGMKFPIDVIILDDTYRVVRTRIALPPNRVFVWNPRYHHVIELPALSVPKQRIQMGEKIQIINTRRS
jgi:uncharacterized membrane protein (UPF0127 family)